MTAKQFADHWRSIVGAVVVTVGAVAGTVGWIDSRVKGHVEAARTEVLRELAQATEQTIVATNMLRCEVLAIPILDCPIHRGLGAAP